MLAHTHLVFGCASILGASSVGLIPVDPFTIAGGMFGSLLPDVDHPKSTFGRKIWPISILISGIFGHRGITHSALAVIGLIVLLVWQLHSMPTWATAAILGYLSHLLADWLTPMGIPFMWPSHAKFRSPRPIRTGGMGEMMLNVAVLSSFVTWFFLEVKS